MQVQALALTSTTFYAGTTNGLFQSPDRGATWILLTNGPSDLQRLKLEQAGLADAFDTVVVSGEAGVGKPDPAVFALVLDQLGAAPDRTVMVGDSWERDVVGALAAGMTAVWIADGRPAPGTDPRVTVVDSVRDLDGLLD